MLALPEASHKTLPPDRSAVGQLYSRRQNHATPFARLGAMATMIDSMTLSTDGSALRNPNGPMGWGWVEHTDSPASDYRVGGRRDAGGAINGTNQIGELSAVLEALRNHRNVLHLTIETDSQYAIGCSVKWVAGWKKRGWRKADKKPISNITLIKAINQEIEAKKSLNGSVSFHWVKGHAGNTYNEMVDHLAHGYSSAIQAHEKTGRMPLEGWVELLRGGFMSHSEVDPAVITAIRRFHLEEGLQI